MFLYEDEQEINEKKSKTVSLDECYNKEWVVLLNKQELLKNFQCLLCEQIANNAMELTCAEHEDQKDVLSVGEQCLFKYLKTHDNQCPIGNHGRCDYVKAKVVRRCVDELMVICPRQFVRQLDTKTSCQQREGDVSTTMITETTNCCTFKEYIKEMRAHLEKSCPLKPLECKFKMFGCDDIFFDFNLEQHLQSQMNKHLNLVLAHNNEIRQDLSRCHQNEIKQTVNLMILL
ncbi:hypothetical protein RFI_16023 [Reticulomyxa filosa]|uniref:TRAF-type domain-containing protein n=1 Tax=Reticulomyxa filosa TaxID=46433 RepID=X6N5Z8_RETFI|nr:hypothetical protein RFI_16023 [Reticulomyxa filosa]|eukprot:ETO21184.1 hypothetical protein RFI_16023 [Reticulomyxa filosa]